MKNIIKTAVLASTFVAIMFIGATQVTASGAYGTGAYGSVTDTASETQETHETVDAGLVEMLPQLVTTFTAISGLFTTGYLLNKTK